MKPNFLETRLVIQQIVIQCNALILLPYLLSRQYGIYSPEFGEVLFVFNVSSGVINDSIWVILKQILDGQYDDSGYTLRKI